SDRDRARHPLRARAGKAGAAFGCPRCGFLVRRARDRIRRDRCTSVRCADVQVTACGSRSGGAMVRTSREHGLGAAAALALGMAAALGWPAVGAAQTSVDPPVAEGYETTRGLAMGLGSRASAASTSAL